jgi:thioredoxin-like negative regulator of GroEL
LPRKVNPSVSEPVQRVLLKALAKDRLDRYTAIEELMSAFKEAWKENSDTHKASLLKAEIEMKSGNQAEAKNILSSLSYDPRTPESIRVMAENYLKTIQ